MGGSRSGGIARVRTRSLHDARASPELTPNYAVRRNSAGGTLSRAVAAAPPLDRLRGARPVRTTRPLAHSRTRDLPVPAQGACVHARVSDHAEPDVCLRSRASVLPSAGQTASALRSNPFAARWLACTFPCRRFAPGLATGHARLGADADRYSFIAVDSHHLLLAGLPAHLTPISPGRCRDRMP